MRKAIQGEEYAYQEVAASLNDLGRVYLSLKINHARYEQDAVYS